MYVQRNSEARSCNHCCSVKTISIKQPECVYVALGIQQAMRMRHIVICGSSRSLIPFHIISYMVRFGGGGGKKKIFGKKNFIFF